MINQALINCPLVAQAKALHDKVAKCDAKLKNEKDHEVFSHATIHRWISAPKYPIGNAIDLQKTEDVILDQRYYRRFL